MKLVFEHYWVCEYVSSGTHTIPFEYSSKEDFQFYVLDLIEKDKAIMINEYGKKEGEKYYRNRYITIFGEEFNVGDLEDSIMGGVYTLEEWFDKNNRNKI